MKTTRAIILLLGSLLPLVCAAGPPDPSMSTAVSAYPGEVSVFSLPSGEGMPLSGAYAFGGAIVDATVTVTLLDAAGVPVFQYPTEDIWLDSTIDCVPGITFCPGGTLADGTTDPNGETTCSNSLYAGACCKYEEDGPVGGLVVYINGVPLDQPPLPYNFNSADVSGDLDVDLTDVVHFAGMYHAGEGYCGDFYWDGQLNLSDVVHMAMGMGAECP